MAAEGSGKQDWLAVSEEEVDAWAESDPVAFRQATERVMLQTSCTFWRPRRPPRFPSCNQDYGGDCFGETYRHTRGGPIRVRCSECQFAFCRACYRARCPKCAFHRLEGLDLAHHVEGWTWLHAVHGASDDE